MSGGGGGVYVPGHGRIVVLEIKEIKIVNVIFILISYLYVRYSVLSTTVNNKHGEFMNVWKLRAIHNLEPPYLCSKFNKRSNTDPQPLYAQLRPF